jgi:hypothetical protein
MPKVTRYSPQKVTLTFEARGYPNRHLGEEQDDIRRSIRTETVCRGGTVPISSRDVNDILCDTQDLPNLLI